MPNSSAALGFDRAVVENARRGAHLALTKCLGLQPGETLGLFYDESTEVCARLIMEAAEHLKILVIKRRVGIAEQIRLASQPRLAKFDLEALQKSKAILLCLGSHVEATPYRKRIIKRGIGDGPLGTMPGATLEVLAHAINVDYEAAFKKCGDLALAMLLGEEAVLTSYEFNKGGQIVGEPHKLGIGIGGFGRSPITSPGIIADGTWGNLPGGETFIAPLEGTAEGIFVLNGAFSGCVLEPGQSIFLEFHRGELFSIKGEGFQVELLRHLCGRGNKHRAKLGLAELGIGVNPGIDRLRGNALFDEKKEGTIHIAVGDNEEYGGKLSAPIHEDFVTCLPSLHIDGKVILDGGLWKFEDADWREDRSHAIDFGDCLPNRFEVQRRRIETSTDSHGRLLVRRDVGAKRVCLYTVGTDEVSRDLVSLFDRIPDSPDTIELSLLVQDFSKDAQFADIRYTRGLIAVLKRHELVATYDVLDEY